MGQVANASSNLKGLIIVIINCIFQKLLLIKLQSKYRLTPSSPTI